ncbi:hypothetical protein [Streptomyces sp. CA-111067]|uniref:hypothetical protein n=1 Tax=Streptomyces sp. CA-111067 TaxID=3240046 RepID=UPI003D99447D
MKTSQALDQVVPLAELNNDKVTPGLLGFVIFAALALGLWLLMKNMGKQMKKIDFEEAPGAPAKPKRGLAAHRAAAAERAAAEAASVPAPKASAESGTPPTA